MMQSFVGWPQMHLGKSNIGQLVNSFFLTQDLGAFTGDFFTCVFDRNCLHFEFKFHYSLSLRVQITVVRCGTGDKPIPEPMVTVKWFIFVTWFSELTPLSRHDGGASTHCCDVIMGAMASQITSLSIVYSIAHSDTDQRKHQSSAS